MSEEMTKTAGWLMKQHFAPLKWAVPGVIPEGCGILAGAPKTGKSWMVLDLALSTAAGLPTLGIATEPRHVLYLALEDSYRRLQDRCRTLLGNADPPEKLEFSIDQTTAGKAAKDFSTAHPSGLLILDTIQILRGPKGASDPYGSDYAYMQQLRGMAPENGTFIGVHHTRKAESDDFLNTISGTQGLSGAADFAVVLDRPRNATTGRLHITGRDVEEHTYALVFDNGRWTPEGGDLATAAAKATEKLTGELAHTIAQFVNRRPATTAHHVQDAFDLKADAARKQLQRLADKGLIVRDRTGVYTPVPMSQEGHSSSSQGLSEWDMHGVPPCPTVPSSADEYDLA